jgi:hypothetical protein
MAGARGAAPTLQLRYEIAPDAGLRLRSPSWRHAETSRVFIRDPLGQVAARVASAGVVSLMQVRDSSIRSGARADTTFGVDLAEETS